MLQVSRRVAASALSRLPTGGSGTCSTVSTGLPGRLTDSFSLWLCTVELYRLFAAPLAASGPPCKGFSSLNCSSRQLHKCQEPLSDSASRAGQHKAAGRYFVHSTPSYGSGEAAVLASDSDEDENAGSQAGATLKQQSRLERQRTSSPDREWLAMLEQLKAYKQQFGDCLVPRRYWENPQLGIWASQQRTDARGEPRGTVKRGSSSLSPQKQSLLDQIEFAWKVEEPLARWEGNFHELRRYREEHGHINVPFKWRDPTYDFNNEFAKWFHAQPTLFAQRRLTVNQVRKLKRVGYDLLQTTGENITAATYAAEHEQTNSQQSRQEFDIMFEELKAWKDTYRTTLVPKQVWDNPVLGMWVHRMRRDFKNKIAPQWQVDKLDSLLFAWEVDQISAKWHHNLHEARRYKELHGTGNIPADFHDLTEPGFVEASRWLQRCAKLFNKDRLTENRYWLLRNILGVKFVREYDSKGIMQAGASGKALARKRHPAPRREVAVRTLDVNRYQLG